MGVNDAREQLEVAKAEVVRLERERDTLARLHEVATERTVELAAVIEKAKAALEDNGNYGDGGLFWGAQSLLDDLDSADTSSALAEIRAKAWDEGFEAGEQAGRMPTMYGDRKSEREWLAALVLSMPISLEAALIAYNHGLTNGVRMAREEPKNSRKEQHEPLHARFRGRPMIGQCATAKCDYPEPHDHGFACGLFCECGQGMQAAKWARFEAEE